MAVSAAPKNKDDSPIVQKVYEKKIKEIINRGGQPTLPELVGNIDDFKSISVKLMAHEIELIKTLRAKRHAPRGKKIPISLHDWIVEAVQEKLDREHKKYQI